MSARTSRDLHPLAWWLWALGLAGASSFTTNPLILLMLIGVAWLVVVLRRSDHPWGQSFRIYAWLGACIVAIRLSFALILGGNWLGGPVLLDLPEIPLPDWVAGISLLGPLYAEALLFALYDGLRLATIVILIGAANSLANPKRVLRSVPPALYEIGTALVVAVTVLPQFAESARRVRAAQSLRAGDTRRIGRLRRFLVPVLEDALDHSMALAAGMDTRGYGRAGDLSRAQRRTTGALMLAGLCGICVGTYAFLDTTVPRLLALPMLGLGIAAASAGLVTAGRRVERTRYRPDPWRWPEIAVVASGMFAGVVGWWMSRYQLDVAYPALDTMPTVSAEALLMVVVALAGPLVTPTPRLAVAT